MSATSYRAAPPRNPKLAREAGIEPATSFPASAGIGALSLSYPRKMICVYNRSLSRSGQPQNPLKMKLVGVGGLAPPRLFGFEPSRSAIPGKPHAVLVRATGLEPAACRFGLCRSNPPELFVQLQKYGDPYVIRTHGLKFRKLPLSPSELRGRTGDPGRI